MDVFNKIRPFFTLMSICCIILDKYKRVEKKKEERKKWLKVKKYNLLLVEKL